MTIFEVLPLCDDILNLMLDFNIGDNIYWKKIFTNEVLKYGLFNIEIVKDNNINRFNLNIYKTFTSKIALLFNISDIYKIKLHYKKNYFRIKIIFKVSIDYNYTYIHRIADNLINMNELTYRINLTNVSCKKIDNMYHTNVCMEYDY